MSDSLWQHWTEGAAQVLTFANARSAFAHVIDSLAPRRVWLPVWLCADMAEAVHAPMLYGLDETLTPDIQALEKALQPGDLLLGVNYFGRPNAALRQLAAARPDVTFVQDMAQATDTVAPPWGQFQIYSPRKLLGVADGGILIDLEGPLPLPGQRPAATAALRRAGLMRARDPQDLNNAAWFAAFQSAEACMTVTDHAMSHRTRQILQSTPVTVLTAPRRANYARLHAHLPDLAFWPDPSPDWTPLGFPIRVPDAKALGAALAKQRIFAPRHWLHLVTDTPPEPERTLQRQLLTLPCDQRYGPEDMDRIARAVRAALA